MRFHIALIVTSLLSAIYLVDGAIHLKNANANSNQPVSLTANAKPAPVLKKSILAEDRVTQGTVTLPTHLAHGRVGETIVFELLNDEQELGTITKITNLKADSFVWFGTVPSGTFYLSYYAGSMLFNIYYPSRGVQMELRPIHAASGEYSLREVQMTDYDKEPDHDTHSALEEVSAQLSKVAQDKSLLTVDTNNIIDVMVLVTPNAYAKLGGDDNSMNAFIDLCVEMSNDAYSNTNIDLRMRLVRGAQLADSSYVEADFSTELDRLRDQTDGYMDTDTAVRASVGADAVVLVVDDTQYCGLGYLTSVSSTAFSLISTNCPQSLVHEVGHNVGCHHDRLTVGTTDTSTYNYGYCWDTGSSSCTRSVMAYSGCVTPNGQSGCPRDFWFSSPLITNGGLGSFTGTALSDNARVTRERTSTAINWMESTTPGGLLFSLSPSEVMVGRCEEVVIEGWSLGTGADITSVTLNGVEVDSIVSQTVNSVTVMAGASTSSGTGDVIVTTSSGYITTLADAFSYNVATGQFTTPFTDGLSYGWESTGDVDWTFLTYSTTPNSGGPLVGQDGGFFAKAQASASQVTGQVAELTQTFNQNPTECMDTVTDIMFYYHLYNQYGGTCQAQLSLQVSENNGAYTTVASASTYQSTSSDSWIPISYTFPSPTAVTGVKIVAQPYTGQDACYFYSSANVDMISLTKSTVCSVSGCSAVATTVPSAVPSTAPSAAPTGTPNVAPTTGNTPMPNAVPTTGNTPMPISGFDWAAFNASNLDALSIFKGSSHNLLGAKECKVLTNADKGYIVAKDGIVSMGAPGQPAVVNGYARVLVGNRPVKQDKTELTLVFGKRFEGSDAFVWKQKLMEDTSIVQFRELSGVSSAAGGMIKNQHVEFVWQLDLSAPLVGSDGVSRTFTPSGSAGGEEDKHFMEVQIKQGNDVRMCLRVGSLVFKQ